MSGLGDDVPVRDGKDVVDRVYYGLAGSECSQLLSNSSLDVQIEERDPPLLTTSSKGLLDLKFLIKEREKDPAGNWHSKTWMVRGWIIRVVVQPDGASPSTYEYRDAEITEKMADECNVEFPHLSVGSGDLIVYLSPKVAKPYEEKEGLGKFNDDKAYATFLKNATNIGKFRTLPPMQAAEPLKVDPTPLNVSDHQ
jgi:hypothetical protein